MANLNRGEHEVTIDDITYTLVLTLDDVEQLESTLDVGGLDLMRKLANMTAFASHIRAVLIRAFSKGRPKLPPKDVPPVLARMAYNDRHAAALALIAGALNQRADQQPPKPDEDEGAEEQKEGADPLSSKAGDSTGSD